MCGIVVVARRPARREPPGRDELLGALERASSRLAAAIDVDGLAGALTDAATEVESVDALLRGTPGVRALLADRSLGVAIEHQVELLERALGRIDVELDSRFLAASSEGLSTGELETINAALVRSRDAVWAVGRDRLRTARAVADLAGTELGPAAIEVFTSVQVALSAIDRLEVRGRDSAGLHVLLTGYDLDLDEPSVARMLEGRNDPLFGSRAVRAVAGALSLVYKAAAEIGELGDNTAALRAAIRTDPLLHLAVAGPGTQAVVLAHTRWASVGIVSEANAHPLNSDELGARGADGRPYCIAALNGDVDNFADLAALEHLVVPAEITTDAKVIPALMARRLDGGAGADDAFRATVAALEGSVAIAAQSVAAPGAIQLALRGSGQALYVGVAEDEFVVASEPYGLVEEAGRYLRLDGETPADPERADATRGQIVRLDAALAGELAGVHRCAYDGTELPVHDDELQRPEITTRDIDRGDFPHFLLKEISESPASFRKTLRGKIVPGADGRLLVDVGPETLPPPVRERLRDGSIDRVIVIGQGTAAVSGQSLAAALREAAVGSLLVHAMPATELSGFGLVPDMRDTLVVAISQSGTTTDTNRTVDLVRARGAAVVAIVNRRNSDLVDKSDGVLYTSDGRDVEMSVASTKAFYAQIAAGFLLALAIAAEAGEPDTERVHDLLEGLRALPDAMEHVIGRREAIGLVAGQHAPPKRYWALVGNGANRIAASELRIKLSELCYKSIACDFTEDKKHIDLSAEPLILVCATGLTGSNAGDVAKEVAIYRAHRATPIVIATDGAQRYDAVETIAVPESHPALGFVLSTVAGHLFGYEAALAIDASARPLREARAAIEGVLTETGMEGADDLLARLTPLLEAPATRFLDGLRSGTYDGHLEASTAVRVAAVLRYAVGAAPLDAYVLDFGKVGTPSTVVDDLTAALTSAIEQLTRPVDAIKHQAKTVTVGISRSDETLLQVPLVREVLAIGTARDSLSYRALRTLVDLDPAVDEVIGFTRYRVEGDVLADSAKIHVVDRGGVAATLRSRTDDDDRLIGTKHRVASEREVTVATGRRDGRTLVIVPEVKGNQTTGLTLLHVRFRDRLSPEAARGVLQGYGGGQGRYAALKDAVTETEPTFDDNRLADVALVDLLTQPVNVLAEKWRTRA
jgi:glucosamine--fructose-6-phosphate aminotransferase (isomerizing)